MKKSGMTAHCLVRNEENWVWYAINSVLPNVSQILVFDTGSTDNTVKIIKSIDSPKIIFEEKGEVDKVRYAALRQEMLERTETDWFMVLDGDEIWPEATIKELLRAIRHAPKHKEAIVVGEWMCQGDVFHYSKEVASLSDPQAPANLTGYRLARAIRKLDGLKVIGIYGIESYADKNNCNVSDWKKKRLIYLRNRFFHMSFLPRSSRITFDREVMMRAPKTRFNKGIPFPVDFCYPEVFFKNRPAFVPSPWNKLTWIDQLKGFYYRTMNFKDRMIKAT